MPLKELTAKDRSIYKLRAELESLLNQSGRIISIRAFNLILMTDCENILQVSWLSDKRLLAMRGMGRKTFNEIRSIIPLTANGPCRFSHEGWQTAKGWYCADCHKTAVPDSRENNNATF